MIEIEDNDFRASLELLRTLTNLRVYEYDSPFMNVSRILKLRGERNWRIVDKRRSVNDTISVPSLYFPKLFLKPVSDRH